MNQSTNDNIMARRIMLGMAEKQATSFLSRLIASSDMLPQELADYMADDKFKKAYIQIVDAIYDVNMELAKVYDTQVDDGFSSVPPQPQPQPQPQQKSPASVPSPNQKACPGCGKPIPKSWRFHQACGWSQPTE